MPKPANNLPKFPKNLPTKLPHLNAAMRLGPKSPGKGMCFHRSVAFVLDVPTAKLCVGIFRGATPEELAAHPNYSPIPFIHCWAEIGSWVYAPTTIEAQGGRLMPFIRDDYYAQNETKLLGIMNRGPLKLLSRSHGLAKHLLYHTPVRGDQAFSDVILGSLGVDYALTDEESVIPTGE